MGEHSGKTLIVVPMESEFTPFVAELASSGLETISRSLGRVTAVDVPGLNACVAIGGHGKTQFGLQTQHFIDACSGWSGVICAGAAGSLDRTCSVGDVVIGTETVEHDMRFSSWNPLPRFPASPHLLNKFREPEQVLRGHKVHFAPIASGDEDVIDDGRRASLCSATGALAVAWEGAGGARAAQFSDLPFVEVRGITDMADAELSVGFAHNLPGAMAHVAQVIALSLAGTRSA